ncbi:fluoride efflux transporter FluC [Haloferula chungangensis]|uniref:Fluoride-specific ion channel FluC n=1 Tax=Haloferula chungangensis TaxID=1048331 RepID=A0ABW2L4I9_9BACT
MSTALLVFLGGGLGAVSRWGLAASVQSLADKTALKDFPWGILACNLFGCYLVGTLFGAFAHREHPAWLFPLAVTGFLGGFTTFSAFGNDTRQLFFEGFSALAFTNVLVSTIGGIALVFLGYKIAASIAS